MQLWIRNQDKEELQKINNRLFIREVTNVGYSIMNDLCTDDGFVTLGTYKSKERALEVLDEIEKLLAPNIMIKSYDNVSCFEDYGNGFVRIKPTETTVQQFSTYVYQMPIE